MHAKTSGTVHANWPLSVVRISCFARISNGYVQRALFIKDGECKSFDARADGYGRGEGAAIVLVKTMEAALRDGDTILATVLGTGANQDGRTPGISMPNGEAQAQLIEQVCHDFHIDPSFDSLRRMPRYWDRHWRSHRSHGDRQNLWLSFPKS